MVDVNKILEDRGKTHGDFKHQSELSNMLKLAVRNYPDSKWSYINPYQRESIEMICHKLSRILVGDPNEVDHWDDIAGYATLVANQLREDKAECNTSSE